MIEGRRVEIRGTVQGVGFRPWVYRLARVAGVTGHVANGPAGVTVEAFGAPAILDAFVERLQYGTPAGARIEGFTSRVIETDTIPPRFSIVASEATGARRASIPPDLATCDACLAEILDPRDRRYRYAFTSCTACGPRFTIALGIPYDRAATTMAPFRMCEECRREYDSVGDRRFHAQPNACPRCGPALVLETARLEPIEGEGDALARAARLIAEGRIVAVKGLGGWHLACDATSEAAIAELRRRKRREEKPLAVMVVDEPAAARVAALTLLERELLGSVERPIVLARRRDDAPVARGVAPYGTRVGLMLPYTPVHHLLLRDAGRPLVMTSGNVSEEPIAMSDEDAHHGLAGIADAFLGHDRAIASRADDSVTAVYAGRPVLWRRSRGFVPRPVPVRRPFRRPVLGCGAHLKNTFCIGMGDGAYLGPHVGDLENLETYGSYVDAIARMARFLGVRPEIVAHDLHPGYLSTRYARSERAGVERVGVQHHHAHVASAMAERGLDGPVLGVVFDGTGYGTDGTLWGGELLVATYRGFERVARLRPVRLPGGERAIRDVWRVALALLDDAFDGDPPLARLAVFGGVPPREIATMRRMIAAGVNAPLSSGLGRYFDAMGAIGLSRARSSHEAQIAMAWEHAADPSERGAYPFSIDVGAAPWSIDLRETVREATVDLLAGRPPGVVSARFHEAVIAAGAEGVRLAIRERGEMPVVLTGGCFQNVRLTEGLVRALSPALGVHLHERVPPGDGGIALGQAVVADAILGDRT